MSFSAETIELGKRSHPQTTWSASAILDALTAALPQAATEQQQQALAALRAGQYNTCKIYPCLSLDDPFIKALGYMSSIPSIVEKSVPTLPTLIGESCRAIADAWYAPALAEGNDDKRAESPRRDIVQQLEELNRKIFAKSLDIADSAGFS